MDRDQQLGRQTVDAEASPDLEVEASACGRVLNITYAKVGIISICKSGRYTT